MTRCTCTGRTRVEFSSGVAFERCTAHDVQRWLLDGRETAREQALAALRGVFTEQRTRPATPRSRRVRRPAEHRPVVPAPGSGTADERLTALLRARGLPGTWAVA